MKKPGMLILTFMCIILPVITHAGWFGPNTYEDCILKNMPGVESDAAARSIMAACIRKYPHDSKQASENISKQQASDRPNSTLLKLADAIHGSKSDKTEKKIVPTSKKAEECVLKYTKNVKSDSAAMFIRRACERKYPLQ